MHKGNLQNDQHKHPFPVHSVAAFSLYKYECLSAFIIPESVIVK